jgi:hypothetical protein
MPEEVMPLITFEQWLEKMETQTNGEKGQPSYGTALELQKKWYAEYLKYAFPYQRDADQIWSDDRLAAKSIIFAQATDKVLELQKKEWAENAHTR